MTRIDADLSLAKRETTEKIIGVFFDTYNELGWGFLESVYENALALSLAEAGFTFDRQVAIPVWFRGQVASNEKSSRKEIRLYPRHPRNPRQKKEFECSQRS